MNVATLKTVSYLGSIALLGGIGYNAYNFFTKDHDVIRTTHFIPQEATTKLLESIPPRTERKQTGLGFESMVKPAIVNFDWTGAPPPPPEEKKEKLDPEDLVPKVKPVSEIVSVTACIADSKGDGGSFALLKALDPAMQFQEEYFRVGDTLPAPHDNVAVFAIRGDGVEFSFEDDEREHESLLPMKKQEERIIDRVATREELEKAVKDSLRSGVVAPGVRNSNRPARSQKKAGVWEIGQEDAVEFEQNYQSYISEVSTADYRDPVTGKKIGMQLTNVPAGSFAARHGAQSGDVLISINGDSVTSEQEAIQYVNRNSEQGVTTWRVRILRLGREVEEVYRSNQD